MISLGMFSPFTKLNDLRRMGFGRGVRDDVCIYVFVIIDFL